MHRTIPQRDLRNDVAEVLRAVEAGDTFTVTVRGRPVARLVSATGDEPRVDVDRATILGILATPLDGDALAADLDAAEAPIDLD